MNCLPDNPVAFVPADGPLLRQQQGCLEREAHLWAILDRIREAVLILDHTGRILEVNAATALLFGVPRSEMPGQRLSRFVRSELFWSAFARGGGGGLQWEDCAALCDRPWVVEGLRAQAAPVEMAMTMVAAMRGGHPCFAAIVHEQAAQRSPVVAASMPALGDERGVAAWVVNPAEIDRYVARHDRSRAQTVDHAALRPLLEGARLLLVEDMPINQQVVKELLERVGIRVDLAEEGTEAAHKAATCRYDAILMDIQMPKMDGCAVTRIIRARERAGGWRVPIIAMTAHALFDDRAHCLEMGMDDHVSKPIDKDRLYACLARWVTGNGHSPPEEGGGATVATEADPMRLPEWLPGIDVADGLYRTGGNHRLYRNLLLEFAREYALVPVQIRTLLAGRRQDDLLLAGRQAHAIQGVAGNLAAGGLSQSAQRLEQAIHDERRGEWPARLDQFEEAMQQVVEGIRPLSVEPEEEIERGGGAGGVSLDRAAITDLLLRLAGFVADGNVEALSCVQDLKPLLRGAGIGSTLRQLDDRLEHFDFEGAQVALVALAQVLEISLEGDG